MSQRRSGQADGTFLEHLEGISISATYENDKAELHKYSKNCPSVQPCLQLDPNLDTRAVFCQPGSFRLLFQPRRSDERNVLIERPKWNLGNQLKFDFRSHQLWLFPESHHQRVAVQQPSTGCSCYNLHQEIHREGTSRKTSRMDNEVIMCWNDGRLHVCFIQLTFPF